jgi:hypothetical protein
MSLTSPKDSSNWRSSRVSNGFDAGVKNYMGNWSHPLTVKNENNMEEQSSNAQSVGSGSGFAFNMKRRKSSTKQHPLFLSPDSNKGIESSPTQHYRLPSVHPTPNKNQVPFLQPIAVRTIHSDPCVDIIYREDAIVTTDRRGRIRTWARPT